MNKTTTRPSRTPISGYRNKVKVTGQEPGYHYRIVNDTGDRISQFEQIGYEIVSDKNVKVGDRRVGVPTPDGSPIKVSVGKDEFGKPLFAYLMRTKQEYFDEDQAAKQKAIDETEAQTKRLAKEYSDYGKIEISR